MAACLVVLCKAALWTAHCSQAVRAVAEHSIARVLTEQCPAGCCIHVGLISLHLPQACLLPIRSAVVCACLTQSPLWGEL